VTKTQLSDFEQIIFADFEFANKPGEPPDVVCLAWHEWPAGQTRCLWRDRLAETPPYRIDERVLFVCFVGNAELGCHLALNWPLPANVLDLSPEFRCITNGRTVPEGRGLLGALGYFHLQHSFDSKRKAELQKRIARGWPFTAEEIEEILRYSPSDVDALVRLLPKMLSCLDLDVAIYRGEFVKASAAMEHHGVPIDMEIFPRLTDKHAWRYVRDAMVPVIDAAYGVYVKGPDGEWHFNMELFKQYTEREGITWPLTEKGKLSTKRKTFEDMSKGHPQLEALRQLRHTRDKMRKIKLAVGADGRNRTVLWPFKSKTGRTQPKASQWIFSPAVWLRSLIRPEPGQAVAYVDWSSMEFMIAASLSDDPTMLDFYRNGDPYLSFAKRVGAAPSWATKATHGPLRDRYKVALLAAQYGIQAEALAGRLGVSAFAAHEMLAQHRELFAVYWRWAEDWLAHVLDSGVMWTPLDWQCRTGITEFNGRSLQNFPVQGTGAEILRIACIWATRRGIGLRAPVHDALLVEAPLERIEADVALLQELMRRASRIVLNPTADGQLELRTDAKIIRYPDRYTDPRGEAIWANVLALLAEYQQSRDRPAALQREEQR
jgi:DNA polymerase-1